MESESVIHLATVPINHHKLVTWSAPSVGRKRFTKHTGKGYVAGGGKNKDLVAFQEFVNECGRTVWGDKPMHEGPVYLDFIFVKQTDNPDRIGDYAYVGTRGDITNYIKAVEDGLQGTIFRKDRVVCGGRQMIVWDTFDAVQVKVYALPRRAPMDGDFYCHPFRL
jgi:Holliday junction resolvase RusA-like endonuclease